MKAKVSTSYINAKTRLEKKMRKALPAFDPFSRLVRTAIPAGIRSPVDVLSSAFTSSIYSSPACIIGRSLSSTTGAATEKRDLSGGFGSGKADRLYIRNSNSSNSSNSSSSSSSSKSSSKNSINSDDNSSDNRNNSNRTKRNPAISSSSFSFSSSSSPSPDRPFSLPPGKFRPKQSLGQNFLSDQNYVSKIVTAMPADKSEQGHRVVEIGPGAGALTRVLLPLYPMMTAIEIDQRAVSFLRKKLPTLNVLHQDVLQVNWSKLAEERGGRVNVIGNLPYYIVSQVLFSLADARNCIGTGTFTMQKEVASRIMSKCSSKEYGIPSVVFQLFSKPSFHFDIPPTVFYPVPKVDSALLSFDFTKQHESVQHVDQTCLRKVLLTTFNKRRKMIRQSYKDIAAKDEVIIPERFSTKRPDELHPAQFVELAISMYGSKAQVEKRREESMLGRVPSEDAAEGKLDKLGKDSELLLLGRDRDRDRDRDSGVRAAVDGSHQHQYHYETIWRKNFLELVKDSIKGDLI